MKKCFIVGSINCDFIIHSPILPKLGETIRGSGFTTANGGKGANQAVALARSGIPTILIGCVGNDVFGKQMIQDFRNDLIDIKNINIVEGVATGSAIITIVDGNNHIILDAGANAHLEQQQIQLALEEANQGDILLTQYEVNPNIVEFSLKLAKQKGLTTIVNPAPFREVHNELYKYIDYIIPNELELKQIQKDISKYNTKLIVTLGENGSSYNEVIVPAIPSKVIDTTAAGDTYIGYFIYGLLHDKTIIEAMKLGTVASSIAVTKNGAQPSIPKIDAVLKKLKSLS
jgi:ribokinase